jgi:KUP system potassium uptake protein
MSLRHRERARSQDKLFIGLARNANDASRHFQLPTDRVLELGTQISI